MAKTRSRLCENRGAEATTSNELLCARGTTRVLSTADRKRRQEHFVGDEEITETSLRCRLVLSVARKGNENPPKRRQCEAITEPGGMADCSTPLTRDP